MSPLTFRRILLLNATFSLASGILMVVFREQLARNLGLADPILLLVVGIGVSFFGGHIAISARRENLNILELRYFAIMDGVWVAVSAALVLLIPMPVAGFWLVVGTALVITDFGILELIGIRSLPHPREQSA